MPKEQKLQKDVINRILFALVLILVTAFIGFIYSRRDFPQDRLTLKDSVLDLTDVDVSRKVYHVVGHWDYYPEQLYSPEDFAAGKDRIGESGEWHDGDKYGTHRLVVTGTPGMQYALSGYSVEYCTRVFVDGTQTASYGVVSDSAATSIPRTGNMMIPFRIDDDGRVEIIYQFSNFVHNEGGAIHEVYLSTPQNIREFEAGNDLPSLFLSGVLLALMFYFLLLAVVEGKKTYFSLALCCLVIAFRDQVFLTDYLLPPGTSWYLNYRIVITVMAMIPVVFLQLLRSFYPSGENTAHAVWLAVESVVELLVILLDTKKLVKVVALSYIVCGAYLAYLLVCLFRRRKGAGKRPAKTEDIVFLSGHGILLLALLADLFLAREVAYVARCGFVPSGMLLFALLVAVATALRSKREREELLESRIRGELLEQMNEMNVDFFHKVAHELKTPLTVISGYAQLTGMQLKADPSNPKSPQNLQTIQSEALRLSDIVTALLEYSYDQKSSAAFCEVEVGPLLERVNAICTPMCLKNSNRLVIEGKTDCSVWGNGEMLLQIFINLVVNANRHTLDGVITIRVSDEESGKDVVFRVCDTGTGIREEVLPHIFEKGYSADDSSGLGLTICLEAVETHGGTIGVERTGRNGTVFRFTVKRKEREG